MRNTRATTARAEASQAAAEGQSSVWPARAAVIGVGKERPELTEPTHYAAAHPVPPDVFLVIEVAHSSVAFDRDVKIPQYARAGIRETCLVDLALQQATRLRWAIGTRQSAVAASRSRRRRFRKR